MSINEWLVSVFWRALAKWVQRDPEGNAERLSDYMAAQMEVIMTNIETASEEEA